MVKIPLVLTIAIIIPLSLKVLTPEQARATAYTPLAWQQEVKEHVIPAFRGQRKNATWIRDRDRNFIDDEIERHKRPKEIVNVIVDLNTCLTTQQIRDLLSKFGRIKYIGKLITFVLLDGVRVNVLPKIAILPQVAMIELQIPLRGTNDVSSRAIQSRSSETYRPNTAQDADLPLCPAPSGCTGANVNIAIVDTGVDSTHKAFEGKFKVGYDANTDTVFTNNRNNDADGHGTHVAGIALGKAIADANLAGKCRTPDDGSSLTDYCGGVATGAGLVDVKVCTSLHVCETISQGLDWIGLNADSKNIRVANISLAIIETIVLGSGTYTYCPEDNGESALSWQVNYLVALGIAVTIGHGNARECGLGGGLDPPWVTPVPGSASFAITVQGTDDMGTINRMDDSQFSDPLRGPRGDFVSNPNILALKPDISAPGEGILSAERGSLNGNGYVSKSGTSMAAPHVAGSAAVLLEARPTLDPGSLKDLLNRTADSSLNVLPSFPPTYPAIDPVWNNVLGSGIVNVYQALTEPVVSDVKFPSCKDGQPAATLGGLCELVSGPPWNNTDDIVTLNTPPQKGVPNTIRAWIKNSGPPATVIVNFGVYEFAAGNRYFHHVGTKRVSISANSTVSVDQSWTPGNEDHQCVQVSIQYGLDSDFSNNVTQRNLEVAPSRYKVRIENPFMVPARMEIRPQSSREGWICKVSETSFVLNPFEDCPRVVQVDFVAPPGAEPGERANCDIAVYATPKGAEKPILIGGVTAQTFVPKPCRIVGQVVDKTNSAIPKARVTFSRMQPERHSLDDNRPAEEGVVSVIAEKSVATVTDDDGIFSVIIPPSFRYLVLVEKAGQGKGQVEQRLECGLGNHTYMLSQEGVTVVKN